MTNVFCFLLELVKKNRARFSKDFFVIYFLYQICNPLYIWSHFMTGLLLLHSNFPLVSIFQELGLSSSQKRFYCKWDWIKKLKRFTWEGLELVSGKVIELIIPRIIQTIHHQYWLSSGKSRDGQGMSQLQGLGGGGEKNHSKG